MTINRENEIEKVKEFIRNNPDYNVKSIQKLLKKHYKHVAALLESIDVPKKYKF